MRLSAVVCVTAAAVLLAACGNSDVSGSGGGGPRVVAAFYPFAYVAEQVAGEHADVDNLTAVGAEPHDLELSPQQVADIADADLVVYEEGFQPAVDDAVQQTADGRVVDVAEVAGLEVADAGELDPHLWLDPAKLVPVAEAVAEQLADADTDHTKAYRANAADLVERLRALDREFASTLADCERRVFVTSHAAFGYLAHAYDLEMVSIAGTSPSAGPSPARLARLRDLVEEAGVTTVFTETLTDPAIAQTLADEAGIEVGVLDPIEGLTEQTADEDYFSLMRSNLRALAEANGCR
ncbi:MAG TPA: metal ABC transporter substrate-binding protein [Nocardioidaceae bacterium]|nr:metal ABC transporter substrate-binding protein [Nocardioidaceae bacterium]